MKLIPLSQGLFAQVDDEDYEYLMQWKWWAQASKNNMYALRSEWINSKNKKIWMHRFLLNIYDKSLLTDHKDHNGLNNQKGNLRSATPQQNGANGSSAIGGSSKYLGVSWYKISKKWAAKIRVDNHLKHLGYFKNEDHAALAYNTAALKHFGEFANLNVVQDNGLFQRLMSY